MQYNEVFKALSDPTRREILKSLKQQSFSVGKLVNKFNLTNATISYHLSILKKANLISETKYKNYIYYNLNTSVFEQILLWFSDLKGDINNEEE